MNILENPFFILKATPRDRKARLIELADEQALHGDQDNAVSARNALSNARSRLAAEVAWFPGLSPKRVESYLDEIRRGIVPSLDGLSALCQANLLAEALHLHAQEGADSLRSAIAELADQVDEFDHNEVMLAINEDRQASGVPFVNDASLVEEELTARCRNFQRTITGLLNDLPSDVMVGAYERLIAEASLDGEWEAPRLTNDLIDAYELHAGKHLEEESVRIAELVKATETASDRHVAEKQIRNSVLEIIEALKDWDRIAQPIQLSRKSRGLDHDESKQLAFQARSLTIHLFNEHDYLEDAQLLSNALQELFAEVAVVSDKIQEDVGALNEIEASRKEQARIANKEAADFAREITYETSFGLIFKDKFRISPNGIDYKGRLTPLDDITGVSWGAVKHYRNGIPTGTTYHFKYCTAAAWTEIQPDEHQYTAIIAKAWRAVCIRILLGMMESWGKGGSVNIGGVEVRDDGLVLTKSHIFKANEQKFFGWGEMSKGASNGNLSFYGKPDKKFTGAFSYKDTLNAHIFDFAIDRIWEGKASRLSRIFGD